MPSRWTRLTAAMDKLYEFDREAVTPDKLQSAGQFAGLFAGEHVAAPEFVIGAFFVFHGVGARDLLGGCSSATSWPSCRGPSFARRSPSGPA